MKNPDGSWSGVPSGVDTDAGNPLGDIMTHHYKSSDLMGNADLYIDWNIWDGLRLNVTGSNLLTFTKFSGLDPEFAGAAKTAYGIYYGSTYPQTRMVALGIDLSF